jgi:Fur family iron response transcriptional regulator
LRQTTRFLIIVLVEAAFLVFSSDMTDPLAAFIDSKTPPAHRRGCPLSELRDKLRRVGLRPTRQRVSLGWLLFAKGDRHITAELLFDEATRARVPVSLATVYNTLHQFTEAGLLRQLAVDGTKSYFDTNPTEHHHFFFEEEGELVDMPSEGVSVGDLPQPPAGMEVAGVEVIVRLRRKVS